MPSSLKKVKKGLIVYAGILFGGQLFFTHCHLIGASGETGSILVQLISKVLISC